MSSDEAAAMDEAGDPISGIMQRLMEGIPSQGGVGAERLAWTLLHQVRETLPPGPPGNTKVFMVHLVDISSDFVRTDVDESERHERLVAVDHLLVNMLSPAFEESDDDLVLRFEELRDGLFNIERINGRNPSAETRLRSIYGGLIELSHALGYVTVAPSTI